MKQVALKRLKHHIDTRCLYLFRATYYILHFIHGVHTLSALPSSVSIFFLMPSLGKMLHILAFQVVYPLNLLWCEELRISIIILLADIEHLSAVLEICLDSLIYFRIGHL